MKKEHKLKKVSDFLNPLHKPGKPFIIKEKDYLWIRKILKEYTRDLEDPEVIMTYKGEDVYFDTVETKVKGKKLTCSECGGQTGKIQFFTVGDEIKTYHAGCLPNIANK